MARLPVTIRTLAGRAWRGGVRRPIGALLHRWRRTVAIKRVARGGVAQTILFVCHGNICRSPYAALALQTKLPPELRSFVTISSGGFIGAGRRSPAAAVSVAGRRGVDLTAHRSSLVDSQRVHQADLVIVMDVPQQREIAYRFGKPPERVVILADLLKRFRVARVIPDPIEQPAEVFESVYSEIDEALGTLVAAVTPGVDARGAR
jgi:protein-tyrosine-phosphatase